MRALHVIAAAALGLGGAALGRWTAPDAPTFVRAADATAAAPASVPAVRVIAPACVAHLGDDDLRRVHDEVVAAMAADPRSEPAPAPAPVAAPSAEQLAAAADADRIVGAAFAAGRWTERDADALRPQLAAMSPDARTAAMQRFAVEVNAGRLRVETPASPF